ncbi:hypothetical protein POV26_01020 [Aequorivita todarodis]|uniref:hypothetical protein n=1 Tax=Aequorivita todarodis TaxID=2036821 RepID=UPI0023502F73|nr:hypothetical protein [Aequorivita todarodis]MDC7999611.1 hypothetical protein [Aequorivita todarodis]
MKEQETKDLEQLVAKAMRKATLETPSLLFTDKVMAAINAEHQNVTVRYRPLIPKYVWIGIAAAIVGITAYLWFLIQPTPLNLPALSFDFMAANSLSKEFSAFTPSKITVYALLLLAVMLCVQVPVLKRYFERREGP